MFPNWFSFVEHYFERHVPRVPLRVLQIGTYTGDATEWLLKNRDIEVIDDIDTWLGSQETAHGLIDFAKVEEFYDSRFSHISQVCKHKTTSDEFFYSLSKGRSYNFIYIDGDHTALQTALDGLNAFKVLEPNGVIAFDDFLWTENKGTFFEPKFGVEAFLHVCQSQGHLIEEGYQVWFQKNG